jgi:hypothetical protein
MTGDAHYLTQYKTATHGFSRNRAITGFRRLDSSFDCLLGENRREIGPLFGR